MERIRIRLAADERRRANHAAVHSVHHRRGRAGLASRRGSHDPVRAAHPDLYRCAAQAPVARHHLWSGAQMKVQPAMPRRRLFRRRYGEGASTVLIGLGIAMLVQPFTVDLYTWSFPVILVGALAFVVTSH